MTKKSAEKRLKLVVFTCCPLRKKTKNAPYMLDIGSGKDSVSAIGFEVKTTRDFVEEE